MSPMVWKFGNMATEFEIFQDGLGQYRCRLKATDGMIISVGRGYSSEAACMNMILKVMRKSGRRNDHTVSMIQEAGQ